MRVFVKRVKIYWLLSINDVNLVINPMRILRATQQADNVIKNRQKVVWQKKES